MSSSDKKIAKLARLYDLSNARDLFTVVMQEMEIIEQQPRFTNSESKKNRLMEIIGDIAKTQSVVSIKLDEAISAYVDDMCRASNSDFMINRSKHG